VTTLSASTRSAARAFFVCVAVSFSQPFFATSSPTPTTSQCAQLRQWAMVYAGKTPTLNELAKYDRPHRIAIFNAVSPKVRSALWNEQLGRLDQRSLSVEQHALISEGRRLTTPALYDPKQPAQRAAAQQALMRFWPRVEKAFPTPDELRPWYLLGSVNGTAEIQPPHTAWDSVTRLVVAKAENSYCVCSTLWGGECSGCGGGGCTWVGGCGPFGDWTCNGTCP
jgi:hypothetical protein